MFCNNNVCIESSSYSPFPSVATIFSRSPLFSTTNQLDHFRIIRLQQLITISLKYRHRIQPSFVQSLELNTIPL